MERSPGSIVRNSRTFAGVGNQVLLSLAPGMRGAIVTDGLVAAPEKSVVYSDDASR